MEVDFAWSGEQEISLVVKPVPKAAAHAATRVPVAQQLVDLVSAQWKAPQAVLLLTVCAAQQISNVVAIKAALERLAMKGRVRLTFKPLSNMLPLVGAGGCSPPGSLSRTVETRMPCIYSPARPLAVQVAFTETPSFTFDLSVLGGDASLLPGLVALPAPHLAPSTIAC